MVVLLMCKLVELAVVVIAALVVASSNSIGSRLEKLVSGKFGEGGVQVVADGFVLVLLVHQFVF